MAPLKSMAFIIVTIRLSANYLAFQFRSTIEGYSMPMNEPEWDNSLRPNPSVFVRIKAAVHGARMRFSFVYTLRWDFLLLVRRLRRIIIIVSPTFAGNGVMLYTSEPRYVTGRADGEYRRVFQVGIFVGVSLSRSCSRARDDRPSRMIFHSVA